MGHKDASTSSKASSHAKGHRAPRDKAGAGLPGPCAILATGRGLLRPPLPATSPPGLCGSSPGGITAPSLQRLPPRSRDLIIRACQFGTQHCNRSSYQQLDTPPRLIRARNTMTVLNRKLDYLFELFTEGWGEFSVI